MEIQINTKYKANEGKRHYLTVWEYSVQNNKNVNVVITTWDLERSKNLTIYITRAKDEIFIYLAARTGPRRGIGYYNNDNDNDNDNNGNLQWYQFFLPYTIPY